MTDNKETYTEVQRAFGSAFADFKVKTKRTDTIRRCDAEATLGTGTGLCDTPLDKHGNCANADKHLS
jgi:hypothetical protein